MKLKIFTLFILLNSLQSYSCSMYKITMYGKTFVGNNEDHWNANTRMWFENSKEGKYGSMYVGYDDMFPQGGMNEKGLVFDGFAIDEYIPRTKSTKPIFEAYMGKIIMQTCQNVEEVHVFLSNYNLRSLRRGMMMFVDKSGKYLVVEADTLIMGNDEKYVLGNFLPSRTPNLDVITGTYQKGRKILEAEADTSLNYLKEVSDSLHQSWAFGNAGTLYTTIFDLNEGTINLFFFHDYNNPIKLSLKDELNRNDHILIIPELFPNNIDGQAQLKRYNGAKDILTSIKETEISKDYTEMAEFVNSKKIEGMLGFFENEIRAIAYQFLDKKDIPKAINVFRLNIRYSPHSWICYDNLADVYLQDKQYDLALEFYTKSIEHNRNNEITLKKIKKLKKRLK